jgi:hypothetical protein
MLMVLSMALLVAPAMQHRLVECGNTSERLLRATTLYAGASLVPLAISLALATLTSHSSSPTSAASERGMVIWDSLPSSECPDFDLPNDRKGAQLPDRWVLSDADDASQTPPRPSYGRNNWTGIFCGIGFSTELRSLRRWGALHPSAATFGKPYGFPPQGHDCHLKFLKVQRRRVGKPRAAAVP